MANNTPAPVSPAEGGFEHYQEKVEGRKVRARSESFGDHFSQAKLFWNSMSAPEKQHIIEAYSFELGKCDMPIREMNIDVLKNIDLELAQQVAENLGVTPPTEGGSDNTKASPVLSQENTVKLPDSRKVGVLIDNGFNGKEVMKVLDELEAQNMKYETVSEKQGAVVGSDGTELKVAHNFSTTDAVLYDALYAVGGPEISKSFAKNAAKFLGEAFDHYKAIGAVQEGEKWLEAAGMLGQPGIITEGDKSDFAERFIKAVSMHRHWEREIN